MLYVSRTYFDFQHEPARLMIEIIAPADMPQHPVNDLNTWALIDPERVRKLNLPAIEKIYQDVLKVEQELQKAYNTGDLRRMMVWYEDLAHRCVANYFLDNSCYLKSYDCKMNSLYEDPNDRTSTIKGYELIFSDDKTKESVKVTIKYVD